MVNAKKGPATVEKINQRIKTFNDLLEAVDKILDPVLQQTQRQPNIVFELPIRNNYWKQTNLINFMTKWNLSTFMFYGCQYNLKCQFGADTGQLMKKGWQITTNVSHIGKGMERKCNCRFKHSVVPGANTKLTESYTPEIAAQLRSVWATL